MNKVTIKDVAQKAGVAPSTVSNALNPNSKKISDSKRKLILEIVEEMGYVPDFNAQKIATKNSRRIGFFVRKGSEFSDIQISEMFIHFLNKYAYENKLDLINIIIPSNDDDYANEVVNRIKKYGITDLIIYGLEKDYDMINTLRNLEINKIFIEIPVYDINSHFVSIDNYKAQRDLTLKVFSENQINKTLYISGDLKTHIGEERLNAIKDFKKNSNNDIDIIEGSFDAEYNRKLLENVDLSKYDYISCGSDDILAGVAKKLHNNNLHPILSGFDNSFVLDNLYYKIYTIEQQIPLLSSTIIDMFIKQEYSIVLVEGKVILKDNSSF